MARWEDGLICVGDVMLMSEKVILKQLERLY